MSLPQFTKKLFIFAACAGIMLANTAYAAAYPDKPITLLVGFSAGSATDTVARIVGDRLTQELKTPVLVENKTGAAGSIAATAVAGAKTDGYTLLVSTSALATNQAVKSTTTFDAGKDLAPIALIGWLPMVLTVRSELKIRTLQDFVEKAKSSHLTYGSSGLGGSTHLAAELFNVNAGLSLTHVPYRGNDQALAALLGGHIDVLFDNVLSAVGQSDNPKLSQIGISAQERNKNLPNVPTFGEQGFEKSAVKMFFGIFGPSALPDDIKQTLNSAVNKVLADPAVVDRLAGHSGMELAPATPQAFNDVYQAELKRWADLAQLRGITLQ